MAPKLKQMACAGLEALFWYSPLQSEECLQPRRVKVKTSWLLFVQLEVGRRGGERKWRKERGSNSAP